MVLNKKDDLVEDSKKNLAGIHIFVSFNSFSFIDLIRWLILFVAAQYTDTIEEQSECHSTIGVSHVKIISDLTT